LDDDGSIQERREILRAPEPPDVAIVHLEEEATRVAAKTAMETQGCSRHGHCAGGWPLWAAPAEEESMTKVLQHRRFESLIAFFLCSSKWLKGRFSMIADYLTTFDFNMPLIDAVNDSDLTGVRSELAALALGEGLDSGYYEAQELAEAFLDAAREANAEITDPNSPARNRLVEIHDHGSSYQRRLFDKVAPLPLADAASDLVWLAALMRDRADMYRPVEAARQSTR
ncbi:MAG TPA: hypothetical protein PLL48_16310, partial [Novosphingobium sp.]|nr:hypothetical protein [Novosphingobium sp.]